MEVLPGPRSSGLRCFRGTCPGRGGIWQLQVLLETLVSLYVKPCFMHRPRHLPFHLSVVDIRQRTSPAGVRLSAFAFSVACCSNAGHLAKPFLSAPAQRTAQLSSDTYRHLCHASHLDMDRSLGDTLRPAADNSPRQRELDHSLPFTGQRLGIADILT